MHTINLKVAIMNTGEEFLSTAIRRMKYYKELGEKTFEQLNDKDFHWLPSSESNSIAVIIQHISGNMLSRWTNFLTEDGEKEWRQRDGEFEIHNYSKQRLMEIWEEGWTCFFNTLDSLKSEDLTKTVYIRKEALSAIDAIIRQLAHYPYHIGQILYIGRMIKNEGWKNLSIPKGTSGQYNKGEHVKDPAKKF
jgi:hypothetical protein